MSMEYIRKTYGVPAKRGARVCYTNEGIFYGTILCARGPYIRVRWDGGGKRSVSSMHPTWALQYLSGQVERNNV
jgi:hypothetical protein